MTSDGNSTLQQQQRAADVESSLEQIKRRLTSASGKTLLQGPLLKRSHALRKWNERWVILDPTTGRMEYKVRRNEPTARGIVEFDDNSTIALSPVNFHGLHKYNGCCFHIGTPSKKDYLFVAQTSGAARAWVSALQATQSFLKAQKEAVNALSVNGSVKLGTVAAALSAAISTAIECSKEIEASMQISMRNALEEITSMNSDSPLDDFMIMKETLRVKDEELENLARDMRARNSTINDLAGKLSDTAETAELAAAAVRRIDQERKMSFAEIERLTQDYEKQLNFLKLKLKESEEKALALDREREELIKQRDAALKEADFCRLELAKARDHAIVLEEAVIRVNKKARDVEEEARQIESDSVKDKQEFLNYMNGLQAELQREQNDSDKALGKMQSCHHSCGSPTNNVNSEEEGAGDEACISVSNTIMVSEEGAVQKPVDHKEGCGLDLPDVGQSAKDGDDQRRVEFTSLRDLTTDEH